MKTVRLQTGVVGETILEIKNISFPTEVSSVKIIDGWGTDDYIPTTLRDISIIMDEMVGQGVTWQLANELSNRLNIKNPGLVAEVLSTLFEEYSELSDDEAEKKWESSPALYRPLT